METTNELINHINLNDENDNMKGFQNVILFKPNKTFYIHDLHFYKIITIMELKAKNIDGGMCG